MSVSSHEVEPETYFWNSASTLDAVCVGRLLYTESWTLNRVGPSLAAESGAGLTGELVVVDSDVDDFCLRYLRICKQVIKMKRG